MMRVFLFCGLFWSLAAGVQAAASVQPGLAGLLDPAGDEVLKRVVVPAPDQPQGEAQLVRRGDLLVVRTLLASRILKRVAGVIDGKEKRSWPEDRPGAGASRRYREELFRATEESWERFRQRTDRSEFRQFLAIEFILGEGKGAIALAIPTLAGECGEFSVITLDRLSAWSAPQEYVHDNMLEIVRDSFRLDAAAAAQLLAPLWPGTTRSGG